MGPGMRNVGNEDRLERLGLFPLERRRLRGDWMEMFKTMRGGWTEQIGRNRSRSGGKDREREGHRFKLICKKSKCDVRIKPLHPASGWGLECSAWKCGGGGFNRDIQEGVR